MGGRSLKTRIGVPCAYLDSTGIFEPLFWRPRESKDWKWALTTQAWGWWTQVGRGQEQTVTLPSQSKVSGQHRSTGRGVPGVMRRLQ